MCGVALFALVLGSVQGIDGTDIGVFVFNTLLSSFNIRNDFHDFISFYKSAYKMI